MNEDEDGPFVEVATIDPALIPDGVHIAMIVDFVSSPIVSQDLRTYLEDEGMTGVQFYDIPMSGDPDAPAPIWKPGVRR
jgi:hypothetical protein